ncbi:MAG TPA: uroporphyrinogen decarboxylase [Planctomycetota bacterium]|nr:uroporphyrinogen decarboxylase [Planctomycetota bacterium]
MTASAPSTALPPLSGRERFLRAARRSPVDVAPIWMMRQAGRYLPEYRALREGTTFMERARSPEIAAELTLQPIRRFGFDAAVIFSDILVPAAAMGVDVTFEEKVGPALTPPVRTRADVERLGPFDPDRRTGFLGEAIRRVRGALGDERAIVGFCGGPWTVAGYLVEGGSSRDFGRLKAMLYGEPETFDELMARLVDAHVPYLGMQVEAGADALQIFESWGGELDARTYRARVLPHLERLTTAAKSLGVPTIVFCNGGSHLLDVFAEAGPDVLSLDWRADARAAVARFGDRFALQGNLDPGALLAGPEAAAREAHAVLDAFVDAPGHVFNLGAGLTPQVPVASVQAVVDAVRSRGRAR